MLTTGDIVNNLNVGKGTNHEIMSLHVGVDVSLQGIQATDYLNNARRITHEMYFF